MAENKNTKMLIGAGIVIVLAIVIVVGFYGTGKPVTTTSTAATSVVTTVPSTSVLTTAPTTIPAGPLHSHQIILGYHTSSFTVGPGLKRSINFTVPDGAVQGELDGMYNSTSGIDVGMVTMAGYNAIDSNPGTITSAANYYGSGTTGTISTPLTPGNYSLIFYNPSQSAEDTVTVAQTILLSYYAST